MVSEPTTSLSADGMIDPAMDPVDRAILACKQMLAMLSARVVHPEDWRVDQELADGSDSATSTPDGAVPAKCSTLGFRPNVGGAEVGFTSMQPDDSSVDQELAYDLDNATSSPDAVVSAKWSTVGLDPNIGAVEAVDSSQRSVIISTVNPGLVGAPPSTTMQQFGILKPGAHTPTTCSTDVLDTDAKSITRDAGTRQAGLASIRVVAVLLPATTPPHRPPPWPEWMILAPLTMSPTIKYTHVLDHVVNTSSSAQDDRIGWLPHGLVDLTESHVCGFVAVPWDPGEQLIRPWLYPCVCCDVNIFEWIGQRQSNATMDFSVRHALPCGNSVGLIDCTDSHVVGLITMPWGPGKKIIMQCCPCGLVNIMEQIWQQQIPHLILLQRKLGVCAKSEMMLPVCSSSCNIGMTTTCRIFVRFSVWSYAEFFLAFSDDSSGDLVRLSVSVPWDSGVFNELSTMTLQSASDLSAASDAYSVTFCGDRSGNLVMLSVNNTGNWDRNGNSQHAFLVVEGIHDQRLMLWLLSPSACGQAEILGEVKRVYTSPSIALPYTSTCSHVQLSETVVSASAVVCGYIFIPARDISNASRLMYVVFISCNHQSKWMLRDHLLCQSDGFGGTLTFPSTVIMVFSVPSVMLYCYVYSWVLGASVVTFSDCRCHPFALPRYSSSSGHNANDVCTQLSTQDHLGKHHGAQHQYSAYVFNARIICRSANHHWSYWVLYVRALGNLLKELQRQCQKSVEKFSVGQSRSFGTCPSVTCCFWLLSGAAEQRTELQKMKPIGVPLFLHLLMQLQQKHDGSVLLQGIWSTAQGLLHCQSDLVGRMASSQFITPWDLGTQLWQTTPAVVPSQPVPDICASLQLNVLWLWDPGGLKPTLGLRTSRNLRRGDCHGLGRQGGPWWIVGWCLG